MQVRDFMFSHNSSFYLVSALVCKQRENRGRDGTNFMDFEALRREPDTSVKIYLSTQKQVGERKHEIVQRNLCMSLFKVGQRQQLGG